MLENIPRSSQSFTATKNYILTKDQKLYSAYGYRFQRSYRLGLLSRRKANSRGHSMYHHVMRKLTFPYKNTATYQMSAFHPGYLSNQLGRNIFVLRKAGNVASRLDATESEIRVNIRSEVVLLRTRTCYIHLLFSGLTPS